MANETQPDPTVTTEGGKGQEDIQKKDEGVKYTPEMIQETMAKNTELKKELETRTAEMETMKTSLDVPKPETPTEKPPTVTEDISDLIYTDTEKAIGIMFERELAKVGLKKEDLSNMKTKIDRDSRVNTQHAEAMKKIDSMGLNGREELEKYAPDIIKQWQNDPNKDVFDAYLRAKAEKGDLGTLSPGEHRVEHGGASPSEFEPSLDADGEKIYDLIVRGHSDMSKKDFAKDLAEAAKESKKRRERE